MAHVLLSRKQSLLRRLEDSIVGMGVDVSSKVAGVPNGKGHKLFQCRAAAAFAAA